MSRSPVKHGPLRQRRELLEQRIISERQSVARAAQQWHEATDGFDYRMIQLSAWRKPVMAVSCLLLARRLRRSPGRLVTLGKRAIALYALGRNARTLLRKVGLRKVRGR